MSSQQTQLDGTTPPADHLKATHNGNSSNLPAEKPNEWFCRECGNRITISPDGTTEYGHARRDDDQSGKTQCSHWIGHKRGGGQ